MDVLEPAAQLVHEEAPMLDRQLLLRVNYPVHVAFQQIHHVVYVVERAGRLGRLDDVQQRHNIVVLAKVFQQLDFKQRPFRDRSNLFPRLLLLPRCGAL